MPGKYITYKSTSRISKTFHEKDVEFPREKKILAKTEELNYRNSRGNSNV